MSSQRSRVISQLTQKSQQVSYIIKFLSIYQGILGPAYKASDKDALIKQLREKIKNMKNGLEYAEYEGEKEDIFALENQYKIFA